MASRLKGDRIILPTNSGDITPISVGDMFFDTSKDQLKIRKTTNNAWGSVTFSAKGSAGNPFLNVKEADGFPDGVYTVAVNGTNYQMYLKNEGQYSVKFARVIAQHINSGYFNTTDVYSYNTANPSADRGTSSYRYSIMEIMPYANDGGTWEFVSYWEGISGYNHWTQTSNPNTTTSSVSGYVGIHINSAYGTWGGISGSDSQGSTRWDGHIGGSWWYAWGCYTNHGGLFPIDNNNRSWYDLYARW